MAGFTEELVKFLVFLLVLKINKPKNVYEHGVLRAGAAGAGGHCFERRSSRSSNRCKFTLFMSWESAKLLTDISTVF